MVETGERSIHAITSAFPMEPVLKNQMDGGLPTALMAGVNQLPENEVLTILSPDESSLALPDLRVRIEAAEADPPYSGELFHTWFGDWWVVLHPDAHTTMAYPQDVVQRMLRGDELEYSASLGTIEQAAEYVEKHGVSATHPDVVAGFNSRFDKLVQNLPDGSILNVQDYMFYPLLLTHADALRERGVAVTFHLHTTLPADMHKFRLGRNLLTAMSKSDVVYLHTDEYIRRAQWQMSELGLAVPKMQRYDLGIDTHTILKGLREVTRETYTSHPEYPNLTPTKKRLVDEVFRTQDQIPHRFIQFDRADEGKGNTVVMEAVDAYLSTLDMSLEDMQKNYRFFFWMPQLDATLDARRPQHNYVQIVREHAARLEQKYPGVVFTSEGVPRDFIPSMLRDANIITGGVQDGLNLAIQEGLKVSAETGADRTAIVGMGAGFAMQTMETADHRTLASFVRVGDVDGIRSAIADAVGRAGTGEMGRKTRELVEKEVDSRTDTIVATPK